MTDDEFNFDGHQTAYPHSAESLKISLLLNGKEGAYDWSDLMDHDILFRNLIYTRLKLNKGDRIDLLPVTFHKIGFHT